MITRDEFLSLVLPPLSGTEQYCTVGIKGIKGDEVRQVFVDSIEKLCARADVLDAAKANAFFAVAKFADVKNGRTIKNAVSLKSFFIDLDCGPNKPFPTLEEGLLKLKQFVKAVKLPRPTIVKSGLGAHVYWILDEPMERAEWRRYAEGLKELCIANKFDVDGSVTSDTARVLRIPFTHHVKDINNPILVDIIYVAPAVNKGVLIEILKPVEDIFAGVDTAKFNKEPSPTMQALMGSSVSVFKTILTKSLKGEGCNQLRHITANQDTISEPLWRAGLSIAQRCTDAEKGIWFISHKYPGYSKEESERKAAATKGPYTCASFKTGNPDGCEGCKLKITSPIQLGRVVVEATPEDNVVVALEEGTDTTKTYSIPEFPKPFFRGKNGGIFINGKGEGGELVQEVIYHYDFYIVKRLHDAGQGEVMLARLHLPKDGVREFLMPLSTVVAKDKFMSAIATQGVAVTGKKQDLLMQYVVNSIAKLQSEQIAEVAHQQFGWTEGNQSFIIGDREITATEIKYSPPSKATQHLIKAFKPKGNLAAWRDAINNYAAPGNEPNAFALFLGLGCPLLRFTALSGFSFSMVSGLGGTGKSSTLHAINSIVGHPEELMLHDNDTLNARMHQMGVFKNIAVTLDEATNAKAETISDTMYAVPGGRGKKRMQQHANAERINNTHWQTGLFISSNRAIYDMLVTYKGVPDGELKRVMETFVEQLELRGEEVTRARLIRDAVMNNYGHAITPFIQAVIAQQPYVQDLIAKTLARVEKDAGTDPSERFWAMEVALATTAGVIANRLGLLNIPVKPIYQWGIALLKAMRARSRNLRAESEDFLGGYIQRHYNEVLVINAGSDNRTGVRNMPIREPRGQNLSMRYEPDTGLLFVVKLSYRNDCKTLFMNYEETLKPYTKSGALLPDATYGRKRITTGTQVEVHSAVAVLTFDTTKLPHFDRKAFTGEAHEDFRTGTGN